MRSPLRYLRLGSALFLAKTTTKQPGSVAYQFMRLSSAMKAQIGQRTLYTATGEAAMIRGARQPSDVCERVGATRGVRVVSLSGKVVGFYPTHQRR